MFVRLGELRRARWKDFDLDRAEWSYRVSKTATDHIGPLSMQAVTFLNELHLLSSSSEFVLSSARTMTRPMSENTINAALRRLRISKDEQTAHVFRAMARTILEALMGYQPE
ncbi:MAG: tyrosine-type recombinase/integrase [Hyphomicrobiaceae bacterium]